MKKLIFLFISILSFCCRESTTNTVITPTNQNDGFFRYTVVKIDDKNVEDFIKISRSPILPREFKFKYINGVMIGTITFEKTGELPIDSIYSYLGGCMINTEGKLWPVDIIDFTFFTFTKDSLNGLVYPVGAITEMESHRFKSVKK